MFTECNAEIIINNLDNGYTVKWEKKKEADSTDYFGKRGILL